jgi:hypothetical protein
MERTIWLLNFGTYFKCPIYVRNKRHLLLSSTVSVENSTENLITHNTFRELTLLLQVGTLWRCGDGLFFRNTSLGKRCTSYIASPTSRKRAADRWSLRIFLPRSSLFMAGKAQKLNGARSELNSVFGLEKVDLWNPIRTSAIQFRSRPHAISGFFQQWKGSSEARNFEVINGLQHASEKWVERCKKCIACQGRYFEKETVTTPPQRSDSE